MFERDLNLAENFDCADQRVGTPITQYLNSRLDADIKHRFGEVVYVHYQGLSSLTNSTDCHLTCNLLELQSGERTSIFHSSVPKC